MWRLCHNIIQDQLAKAFLASTGTVSINRIVPGCGSQLHTDNLVIDEDSKHIMMVDVAGSHSTYYSTDIQVASLLASQLAPHSWREPHQLIQHLKALGIKEAQEQSQGREMRQHWWQSWMLSPEPERS